MREQELRVLSNSSRPRAEDHGLEFGSFHDMEHRKKLAARIVDGSIVIRVREFGFILDRT
jgi:hypothetical protein